MLDSELKSKVNQLWDKFWSGGLTNPLQAIEQITCLLSAPCRNNLIAFVPTYNNQNKYLLIM